MVTLNHAVPCLSGGLSCAERAVGRTSQVYFHRGKSLCCVCAGDTHRLLLSWHSLVQSKKAGYLECVNNSIPGGVVAIEPTCCERIVERIAGAAIMCYKDGRS